MQQRPKIRPALLSDYAQVAALEVRYGLKPKTEEEWRYLWTANPAYVQGPKHWPIGWVLETCSGEIVGYLGNIPLCYELEGRQLLAAAGRSWVVDRRYRALSLTLLCQFYRQQSADLFLHTSVGPDSVPAFNLVPAARVPIGVWDTSAYWITNYRGFASSVLAMKHRNCWEPTRCTAAAALWVADHLRSRRYRNDTIADIQNSTSFDDRFETFWQQLRGCRQGHLLAVRSREALGWHYHFPLKRGELWITTASIGADMKACAVFRRQDNPQYNLKRMRLVDFFSLFGDQSFLPSLLLWAIERCKREGIHVLDTIGDPVPLAAENLAARLRPLGSWLYLYHAPNRALAEKLRNPAVWSPTLYDGDVTL